MTLQEMYDELEARLQPYDPDREWTPLQLVNILNRAQRIAAAKLNAFMIPELVNSATGQATGGTSGFDLTGLDPIPFSSIAGIISIKHSGGYYCKFITDAQRQEDSDNSVTYVYTEPKWWVIGETLYVVPHSGYTFDITYKAIPDDMWIGAKEFDIKASTGGTNHFWADAGQSLSTDDDYYNGGIIFLQQFHTKHTVMDYTGSTTLYFRFSPLTPTSVAASGTFILQHSSFDDYIKVALSEPVQDVILEIAEARALKGINNRASLQTMAYAQQVIDEYNALYVPVEPTRFDEINSLMRR